MKPCLIVKKRKRMTDNERVCIQCGQATPADDYRCTQCLYNHYAEYWARSSSLSGWSNNRRTRRYCAV